MSVQSFNPFVLFFTTACLLFGTAAQADEFSVALSITVSGVTSGSGSGSGTASLDTNTGALTMNLNSTTVTGFTDTSVVTVATVTGTYSTGLLSSVSGNSQLISCTNNGGLVNGCNSINSDFGAEFLTDPIDFDLAFNGQTVFTVTDNNSGAVIEQTFTLVAGGAPPPGPPATIDLTSGGPTQYTFDPGNGQLVTLFISANSGSVTQGDELTVTRVKRVLRWAAGSQVNSGRWSRGRSTSSDKRKRLFDNCAGIIVRHSKNRLAIKRQVKVNRVS